MTTKSSGILGAMGIKQADPIPLQGEKPYTATEMAAKQNAMSSKIRDQYAAMQNHLMNNAVDPGLLAIDRRINGLVDGNVGNSLWPQAPNRYQDIPGDRDEKTMMSMLYTVGRGDHGAFRLLHLDNATIVVAWLGGGDLLSFTVGKRWSPDMAGKFMAWAGLLPTGGK